MPDSYRRFQAGPDPFGRTWEVEFQWLQTGISIRHADTVDVKFYLWTEGEPKQLLIAASNTLVDGEDFGWLWDVDFESMAPKVDRAVVSGTRADELANRLHYAGVPMSRIQVVVGRREEPVHAQQAAERAKR